ncbi:MAG: hypothetical protein KME12_19180 [Trichocoleus desertorum ATA4-8-CV12]|jgi:hypothetical protein|nr:hypothetical protein [Trichocoleus desertorum ATA4-8-CV12]
MLSRPTLSKSAVSFSPFVSLLVALVELAIANLSLFYCSGNQHLTFQQAIAHSTSFYLSPGQRLTNKQAIANFNLFSFSTKQSSTTKLAIAGFMFPCLATSPQLVLELAIAAVIGQGSLFGFLALCAPDRRAFCHSL